MCVEALPGDIELEQFCTALACKAYGHRMSICPHRLTLVQYPGMPCKAEAGHQHPLCKAPEGVAMDSRAHGGLPQRSEGGQGEAGDRGPPNLPG